MMALNGFFVKRDFRNQALALLEEFIRSQPPHLHLVLQTPLFASILQSLQKDSSTTTVAMALVSLNMLLPYIPTSLVPFLPTLFNIYARLLFWDRDKSFAVAHTEQEVEAGTPDPNSTWEECYLNPDHDPYTIPHLADYFTLLYGLYPINFVDYIRKPQRYLRHANNAEDIDVEATEIRHRSGRFRQFHLLHPNFYNLTIESEKTDLSRWIKSDPHEVLGECTALSVFPDAATEGRYAVSPPPGVFGLYVPVGADRDGLNSALLSSSIAGDATSSRDSLSATWRQTQPSTLDTQIALSGAPSVRRNSQSSHVSAGKESGEAARPRDVAPDSPTLPPHLVRSPSNSQLQDMIQSNKVIKSGLHQSLGNESVLSLPLSQQESIPDRATAHIPIPRQANSSPGPAVDNGDQLSQVYHQNLLLQNDLQFERYVKQQHMAHIGGLRRKQLREEATEAETQNLVMAARNLRHRLDEAKRGESQIKKEADHRRNMSKKWESDLTARLKNLREEQKKWAAAKDELENELGTIRTECERLRQVVTKAEEAKVRAEQALEAIDINADEIERLRGEVAQLTASEREFQGKQTSMQLAMEEAAASKAQASQLDRELRARDEQLRQSRHMYESQIVMLSTKLADAREQYQGDSHANVAAVFESALAASRAKQTELQKQYTALMRKYTVLQSSLLDFQSDAAEKKGRATDKTRAFDPDAETSNSTSPVDIRRGPRGLSEADGSEGSPSGSVPPRPSTPVASPTDSSGAGKSSPERYFGRGKPSYLAPQRHSDMMGCMTDLSVRTGGIQNTIRKDRKEKDEREKKDKKSSGIQRIRGFV